MTLFCSKVAVGVEASVKLFQKVATAVIAKAAVAKAEDRIANPLCFVSMLASALASMPKAASAMASHLLVFAFVMAFALSGCGMRESDDTSAERVVPEVPQYPDGTFVIDPDEGEPANFSNLSAPQISTTYFEKRFNRASLDAVLRASGDSTADFLKQIGVSLYRVPRPDHAKAPIFFRTLEPVPSELDFLWKGSAGAVKRGILVGLYVDLCYYFNSCEANRVVRPLVLVDEAGDRWTLVHELMHYLFDAQRRADGENDYLSLEEQRQRRTKEIVMLVSTYRNSKTEQNLMAVTTAHEEFVALLEQRLRVKEFEETATELTLLDEWKKGRLGYVPPNAVNNAVWYMNEGRTMALAIMNEALDQIAKIESEAKENQWKQVAEKAAAAAERLRKIKASSREMIDRAQRMAGYYLSPDDLPPDEGATPRESAPQPRPTPPQAGDPQPEEPEDEPRRGPRRPRRPSPPPWWPPWFPPPWETEAPIGLAGIEGQSSTAAPDAASVSKRPSDSHRGCLGLEGDNELWVNELKELNAAMEF